jgi:crossover junction endodeoxyribonuclease RusA
MATMADKKRLILLDVPVSLNKLYVRTKRGIAKSDAGKAYTKQSQWKMRAQGVEPIEGDCAVVIRVYRKAKRGDLDNYLKLLLDTLEGAAYHNDNQIVELHAYRYDDRLNPRVEISVSKT